MTSPPQRTRRKAVPHRHHGERRSVPAAPPAREIGSQRIAKLLARAGVASRRELKRQLELPRTRVVRTYRARAFGQVKQSQLEALAEGITIDGMHYGSINANLERRTGSNCWVELSLTEGKNREVRRVLEHLGLQVSRLIRTGYGPLTLEGLEPGDADEVGTAELEQFGKILK